MLITTSQEIRELTGSQYANNSIDKIKVDILLQTEELAEIVGDSVIAVAQDIYDRKEDPTTTKKELHLLQAVQLPIAIGAAFRYNQSNLVSHDDTGRKAKLDKQNESMAWEWMIERDDRAAQRKLQKTTDRLISILNREQLPEWINSEQIKQSRELFIPDTKTFSRYFNIDNSPTFYYRIQPVLRDIQHNIIRPALGDDFQPLLLAFQENTLTPDQEELLSHVQSAIPLKAVSTAIRRHIIQYLPEGIVQGYRSFTQSMESSNAAPYEAFQYYLRNLDKEAAYEIDLMKRFRSKNDPKEKPRKLIPTNDPRRKFART